MPQFEFENVGPQRATGFYRGRTPEDAVARACGVAETSVAVTPEEGYHGWLRVAIDGAASGRLRPRSRQQFRRDV